MGKAIPDVGSDSGLFTILQQEGIQGTLQFY
jgi:hypothetical protein